jgi:HEAT repeats
VLEADGNKLFIQTLLGPTSVRPGMLPLPGAPRLSTVVAAAVGGARLWAIEVDVRRGNKTVAELWVGRAANGGFGGELMRLPLGPQGGDGEYGAAAELSARGLVRWQTRPDLVRCDGAALRLFAERWDPASRRWAPAEASEVPASADGVATVTAVTAPAAASSATGSAAARAADVFRARSTTSQRGAARADELAIPSELDDGDPRTAWKSSGDGRGEVLGFRARLAAGKALRLRVVPGDASSASAFRAAARPAKLWIIGKTQRFTAALPDATTPGAGYLVALPQPIEGCLSVLVESVHPAISAASAAGAAGAAGAGPRPLAISELSIETDLEEQSGGGTAALAAQVARGGDEGGRAAAILARRGDAAATALLAELARAQEVAQKRRLARALAMLSEKQIAPALVASLREGWIGEADLPDAVNALARIGADEALAEIAASEASLLARTASASALARAGSRRLLTLAGVGPTEVRRQIIGGLERLPVAELLAAAGGAGAAAATGDLWRAAVRAALHAPAAAGPAERKALVAALAPQLAGAPEYERRYRLVTSLAELAAAEGDAATLDAVLAELARLGQAKASAAEAAALRQAVAELLARSPRAETAPALVRLLGDGDAGVRLAVARRLHSPDGLASLDRALVTALGSDGWPIVRRAAAAALGQRCQRPEPATALDRAVTTDADLDVRQDALLGLVTCRAPGIAERLVGLWSSGEPPLPVKSRAVTLAVLLGEPRLGRELARSLARWRSEAFSDAESLQLAVIAAAALGRLGGPDAAPALLAALDDTAYPEIVAAAAAGLGALGQACPAEARAKLSPLTRSDERSIALSARRALALCGSGPAVRSPDAP